MMSKSATSWLRPSRGSEPQASGDTGTTIPSLLHLSTPCSINSEHNSKNWRDWQA